MPGIDLSTVNGPDLRRLLRIAHSRRDGLLADRLEWEIAERRATRVVRSVPRFTKSAEDGRDEPAASDAPSFAPAYDAPAPASGRRSVLLVTLGAVAGSLVSASVLWGLGRMEGPSSPGRAQAMMAMGPAEPVAAVTVLTPQPRPPLAPEAAPAAPVEAAVPAATPSVQVAKAEGKQAARSAKVKLAANAERPPRPPTLSEWLAQPEPAQHIEPDEPIH